MSPTFQRAEGHRPSSRSLLTIGLILVSILVPALPQPAGAASGTFRDDDGSTHEGYIEAIAAEGITRGCGSDRFCPEDPVTRGEMAAFLHRSLRGKVKVGSPAEFSDVGSSRFAADIAWLSATGITKGCTSTRFCPNDTVTRGQVAAFLHRALESRVSAGKPTTFSDIASSTFRDDIEWLSATGITRGCDTNKFCPNDDVTREQMASLLARALGLKPIRTVSAAGNYGASSVGPHREKVTDDGVVIASGGYPERIEGADPGDVMLIRGGSYTGGFTVPKGVTVKPYNGESVTISGQIEMESDSTVAGLHLRSSSQWVIRVDSRSSTPVQNVTIRNNEISGGEIESIRVSRNAKDVLITGNEISGGGNHNIKVHGDGSGYEPTAVIRNNVIGSPVSEDGIQTEDNGPVTIDSNTFNGAPENNIDVKSGTVTITNNLFPPKSSDESSVIVHGLGAALVAKNHFATGTSAELGSRNAGDPSWLFRDNRVEGGSVTIRRSSRPVIVEMNTFSGGELKLGLEEAGDHPTDLTIRDNQFDGTQLIDRVSEAGEVYTCEENRLTDVQGDWSMCS